MSPALKQLVASQPGDYRILNLDVPNEAMSVGSQDIWGYDAGIPLRYAQLMALTQGVDPDEFPSHLQFSRDHSLFAMLRCRYVLSPPEKGETTVYTLTNTLPHVLLVPHYRVLNERKEIFAALQEPSFDPRNDVILETAPIFESTATSSATLTNVGSVTLVDSSTDSLTIKADLTAPAILLITDTYVSGWRATALAQSVQSRYTVLPANWCLRAVPLAAGRHNFRLEYLPNAFVFGKWVSVISWVFFLVIVGLNLRQKTADSLRGGSMTSAEG